MKYSVYIFLSIFLLSASISFTGAEMAPKSELIEQTEGFIEKAQEQQESLKELRQEHQQEEYLDRVAENAEGRTMILKNHLTTLKNWQEQVQRGELSPEKFTERAEAIKSKIENIEEDLQTTAQKINQYQQALQGSFQPAVPVIGIDGVLSNASQVRAKVNGHYETLQKWVQQLEFELTNASRGTKEYQEIKDALGNARHQLQITQERIETVQKYMQQLEKAQSLEKQEMTPVTRVEISNLVNPAHDAIGELSNTLIRERQQGDNPIQTISNLERKYTFKKDDVYAEKTPAFKGQQVLDKLFNVNVEKITENQAINRQIELNTIANALFDRIKQEGKALFGDEFNIQAVADAQKAFWPRSIEPSGELKSAIYEVTRDFMRAVDSISRDIPRAEKVERFNKLLTELHNDYYQKIKTVLQSINVKLNSSKNIPPMIPKTKS